IDATKKEKIVDKTGSWDKNLHRLTYTVDINPSAENLLTGSGGTDDPQWLSLKDVLTYTARHGTGTGEAILSLNSVKLEKEENDGWSVLNNIQWTAHTETDSVDQNVKQAFIEMEVPDSTHLRLTYSYQVNSSMSGGITLTNSATLEGHGDESGNDSTHIKAEDFDTFGESTFEEFWLIKIDEVDGRPLPDAVFTVYTWDAVNGEWVATTKTYTTDSGGKITIRLTDTYDDGTRVYQTDTAYCIMETTAPPGYILPENPEKFYFWFSKRDSAPQDCPGDFMLTAADISTSSFRIEAENQPIPELTITKTVTGALGDKTKEFLFTLTVEDAAITDEYAWSINGVRQAEPLHNRSTFTLKHGDVVKIMLPVNKDITIEENNLDYSVSMKLDDAAATEGNIKTFRICEDATLAVTNDRDGVVQTGVFRLINASACVILSAVCLIVFLSILLLRTRKKGPWA
ncbi:MAG: hypothetical protein II709_00855, partial [Ruminococcus sp.]|nr:hypothetical protein [Ruminococcus sp.]